MAIPQTAFFSSAEHRHQAGESCPYCEQPIPNERVAEIHEKYALKQQRDEAAMKMRVDQQVTDARIEIEKAKKAEIEKIQQDGLAVVEKVKADALALQNIAREEGKKAALAEAQKKMDDLAAEQAAAKLKIQEAEQQKIAALTQLETLKAQTEIIATARAAETRAALEKSNAEAIKTKDAQHAEAMQKLADQMAAMQRRIDVVEGEGADIKLLDALKEKFPEDDITHVNKASGADIIHIVKHKRKECGKIIYDSRSRNLWQANFAASLRNDMVAAKAQHAILTTNKFPTGARQIHLCEGVIVANPARVLILAEILRDEVIRNYSQRVGEQDREQKTEKLYKYIASSEFNNSFDALESNEEKLIQVDEDEQKAHKTTWQKRRRLITESQRLHGTMRTEIARIIGTEEAE